MSIPSDTPATKWFKSSYSSSGDGNDCVEVGPTSTTIHIRDSKNLQGSRLAFTPHTWAQFVTYAAEVKV